MQQDREISDDLIQLTESILLPRERYFDQERLQFIKDFTSLDLHAVPGSGKTTALLAKLIILESFLPFTDGRGILVISHTNAAVDEIKKKIGQFCPRLFNYPNFIGTIQGFVDTFLAIPYYKTLYQKKPVRIDDEIYKENHFPDYNLKAFLKKRADGDHLLYNYRLKEGDILKLKLTNDSFVFKMTSPTAQKFLKIKKDIREKGFLCFDDAYILADEYLKKNPRIINILRRRFKYVFVDEMQDMDKHQYDLLEHLFGNATDVVYQRIGDRNQAIFNDDTEMQDIWVERNVKELNGSYRLHPLNAILVELLALSPIGVKGYRTNDDGSQIDIQPTMLIYDDTNMDLVIERYATIIHELVASGKIDLAKDNTFKAIAWTTMKPSDKSHMIKLNHFYPSFSKDLLRPKINYPCLESYLYQFDPSENKLSSVRKSILNAILRVLRYEQIINPDEERSFTKRSLITFLKESHVSFYQEFKLKIYQSCVLTMTHKTNDSMQKLTEIIISLLGLFEKQILYSKKFISDKHSPPQQIANQNTQGATNYYHKDGINIEVATVHSVKGQTHTCTLYLESFYQTNVQKKGNYESSRLADPLLGVSLSTNAHEFIKHSMKMAYVGFSRPTHLLCFAMHKSRFEEFYFGRNLEHWQIEMIMPKENKIMV